MGWFQKLQRMADTSDPVVSWGERIFKVLLWVLGAPVVSGLAIGAVAWLSQNLLYGVLIGLAAWVLSQIGFTVWGIRLLAMAAPQPTPQTETPDVELVIAERDEARAERDALREEVEHLKAQPEQRGELKRRTLQLSDELFRFVKARDEADPQNKPGWSMGNPFSEDPESRQRAQEQTQHDEQTWSQYRQQYEGELRALLHTLEQRGLCDSKERKEIEDEMANFFLSPTQRIGRVAPRLAAMGKRL